MARRTHQHPGTDMSQYRRARYPGGLYFFTVVTHHRAPLFSDESHIGIVREAFRKIMTLRPFQMDAIVVLPEHLHCIWRMPEGDADYASRWREIKKATSRQFDTPPTTAMSKWYGNGAFGNTPFATRRIGANTWITSITTR